MEVVGSRNSLLAPLACSMTQLAVSHVGCLALCLRKTCLILFCFSAQADQHGVVTNLQVANSGNAFCASNTGVGSKRGEHNTMNKDGTCFALRQSLLGILWQPGSCEDVHAMVFVYCHFFRWRQKVPQRICHTVRVTDLTVSLSITLVPVTSAA